MFSRGSRRAPYESSPCSERSEADAVGYETRFQGQCTHHSYSILVSYSDIHGHALAASVAIKSSWLELESFQGLIYITVNA